MSDFELLSIVLMVLAFTRANRSSVAPLLFVF